MVLTKITERAADGSLPLDNVEVDNSATEESKTEAEGTRTEIVHLLVEDVDFSLGEESKGSGKLYITTMRVAWLSDMDPEEGYGLDYQSLLIHAVCRDDESFERPCIYCQIDSGSEFDVFEARLVPSEHELENVFNALSYCAALNPDPQDEDEEEDDDNQWFTSSDIPLTDEQIAVMSHLDSVLHVTDENGINSDQMNDEDGENEDTEEQENE